MASTPIVTMSTETNVSPVVSPAVPLSTETKVLPSIETKIPSSTETKSSNPIVSVAFEKITSIKEIAPIIEERFKHLSFLPRDQFNLIAYGGSVLACDVDDMVFMNEATRQFCITGLLDGVDCKVRGLSKKIGDDTYTLCEVDTITEICNLEKKGMKIIFVTRRGKASEEATYQQLQAFGIRAPQVWCTAGIPKGTFVKEKLPGLDGGLLFVVDDEESNLQTYVSDTAYRSDRVVLLQYMTYTN